MRRAIFLVVVLVLVATACGGGGSDNADSTSPSTTVSLPPATTAPPAATTTTSSSTTTSSIEFSGPNIGNDSTVVIRGLGPVRVGMTPEEASIAAGYQLEEQIGLFEGDPCFYLSADPYAPGVSFMVNNGTVARVDILTGPVTTRSGAGIGMTEDAIRSLFPGQIEQRNHFYVEGGKYLEFVPVDEADTNFRVVFETDPDGVVTMYRAGRLPEVRWVEGCA